MEGMETGDAMTQPDRGREIAQGLMMLTEGMTPIIEWAEGQKSALITRGWSIPAAEQYATELLLLGTRLTFSRMMPS